MEGMPQVFPVLAGLWGFYLVRARLQTARELGEQLLSLAQSVQDPALFVEAYCALGHPLFDLGEFSAARAVYERGIALYDSHQHSSLAFVYGYDPKMDSLAHLAWVLWYLGYPDQAREKSQQAVALARELSHPFSLAHALDSAAMLHQHCGERQAVQERVEAALTLSTEQGFALTLAWETCLGGWIRAERGQREEGIAQIRQGLAAFWDTGGEVLRPYFLALLAEECGKAGPLEEGLAVLAEALAITHKNQDRFYEAELYRLKGELTLKQSRVESLASSAQKEAEGCFHKAIAIARRQNAKSLELRAVMSLARLWQQQGKQSEAHKLLSEVYNWFTEGFDTKDLQEAKALLEELAG
jgi:predicted ATPase